MPNRNVGNQRSHGLNTDGTRIISAFHPWPLCLSRIQLLLRFRSVPAPVVPRRPPHAPKLPILTNQQMDAKSSTATGYNLLGTTHQALENAMAVQNSLRGRARREKRKESNRHVAEPRQIVQSAAIPPAIPQNPLWTSPQPRGYPTRNTKCTYPRPSHSDVQGGTRHAHPTFPDRL